MSGDTRIGNGRFLNILLTVNAGLLVTGIISGITGYNSVTTRMAGFDERLKNAENTSLLTERVKKLEEKIDPLGEIRKTADEAWGLAKSIDTDRHQRTMIIQGFREKDAEHDRRLNVLEGGAPPRRRNE